jgi:hypothetical protein
MRLYAVAMFVHILGVIALFGSFVIVHRVPPRLRGATRYNAARTLGRTGLATAAGAANGAALGVLWLMTARPGVVESVSVVTVATVVGALVGRRAARA